MQHKTRFDILTVDAWLTSVSDSAAFSNRLAQFNDLH